MDRIRFGMVVSIFLGLVSAACARSAATPASLASARPEGGKAPVEAEENNEVVVGTGQAPRAHPGPNEPTLADLGRLERLRLHDLPEPLADADLGTSGQCKDGAGLCSFQFRLESEVQAELLRVQIEHGDKELPESIPIEIVLSGPTGQHTFATQTGRDLSHVRQHIALVPGTYVVTFAAPEHSKKVPVILSDFVWFGTGADGETLELKPSAMVVMRDGPFFAEGPEYSTLAQEAYVVELDEQLRPHRRFFGSEVFGIEGSPYALVRLDGTVTCPGAFHDYQQRLFVLDTRSGLLALWQETSSASLFLQSETTVVRSISWGNGASEVEWVDVDLSGPTPRSTTTQAEYSAWAEEKSAGSWSSLVAPLPEQCQTASASEVAAYNRLVPDSTQADLSQHIVACRVTPQLSFVTYSDPCWNEVNALVLMNGNKAKRLGFEGRPSEVEVRLVHGRFLVFTWDADVGRIFEVTPEGQLELRFEHAAFGTRAAESCRCSA